MSLLVPTLALESIVKKWKDALVASTALNGYCQTNFGKLPKIYVGLDPRVSRTQTDCPYIAISPISKQEGLDHSEYKYTCIVGWVILNNDTTTTGNVTELDGVYQLDQLGQLIWQAIADINPNYPLSDLDYNVDMLDYVPQFAGHANITLTVPITMGAGINY